MHIDEIVRSKRKDITQSEIAAKMGISRQALSKSLASGNMGLKNLIKLGAAMGYSVYLAKPGESIKVD